MTDRIRKNIEDAEMNFFMDADIESIHQHLSEMGIVGSDSSKKQLILKRLTFLAKAATNQQRDKKLLLVASKCKEAIEKNIDKPIRFLRGLMASKVSASYNKTLDKLSQEEIVELIKDQNLVNLLDQLEQDGIDFKTEI